MKKTFTRTLTSLGLTLALLTMGSAAQAALVNYSFNVTIDTAGPLLNQSFSGNLSYDDALPSTLGVFGEELFDLDSFSFSFDGATYGLSELVYGYAVVDGGVFTGLDAGASLFSFLPASVPFDASFAFEVGQDAGNGVVTYVRDPDSNNVPEPATGVLLAVGLLAAAALRKPRSR